MWIKTGFVRFCAYSYELHKDNMLLPESSSTNNTERVGALRMGGRLRKSGREGLQKPPAQQCRSAGQALCSQPSPGQTSEEGKAHPPSKTIDLCLMETSKKNQGNSSGDLAVNAAGWGRPMPWRGLSKHPRPTKS